VRTQAGGRAAGVGQGDLFIIAARSHSQLLLQKRVRLRICRQIASAAAAAAAADAGE